MKNTQSKTARDDPAPLRDIKRWGERSALGDERRHIDRRAVELPAHAELQVVRGDVLELHGAAASEAGEVGQGAGDALAEVDVAIREFKREARVDLIGKTGVRRPGEIPFRGVRRERNTAVRRVDVLEVGDGVARRTHAGTDERGDAPPGAEVDVSVGEEEPLRLAAVIFVGKGRG